MMDHETKQKIYSFAKLIGSCKQEELNEMFSLSEEEWRLNSEDKERGISYPDWIRTVSAVSNMKEKCKNYLNEAEFWRCWDIS